MTAVAFFCWIMDWFREGATCSNSHHKFQDSVDKDWRCDCGQGDYEDFIDCQRSGKEGAPREKIKFGLQKTPGVKISRIGKVQMRGRLPKKTRRINAHEGRSIKALRHLESGTTT